jgi:predicted  nucleic acid-binding Zn-ribbon protein
MSQKADERAVQLEESTRHIDELMQERVGFEQTITELQGRLKEQRKAHQGTWNSVLEIVPAVDNSIV